MELTKEIWFDTNSMPPKNMIWYRGKGKFYEWRNDVWVVAYDLGSTPSQEELNDIAEVIESKTGEELQDKSLSGILNGILELVTQGGGGGSTKHVLSIESETPGTAESYTDALARIKYDGAALTLAQLPTIDWPNTIIVDATGDWPGWQFAITEFAGWDNKGAQIVGGSWKDDEFGIMVMIQIVDEPGETVSSVKYYSL